MNLFKRKCSELLEVLILRVCLTLVHHGYNTRFV